MSNILRYNISTGAGKEYFIGNTPDYSAPIPPDDFLINPDVSAVAGINVKYWKVVAGIISEMSAAEKEAIDDAEQNARQLLTYPAFTFLSNNIFSCDNADWAVNSPAIVESDPLNNAIKIMRFNNGAEKGIGFFFIIPSGIKKIVLTAYYRAENAPGIGKTIKTRLYSRDISNAGGISVWRQNAMDDIEPGNNINFNKFQVSKKISALGCTENYLTQFQFTRRGANDTLGVDMLLNQLIVNFK